MEVFIKEKYQEIICMGTADQKLNNLFMKELEVLIQ